MYYKQIVLNSTPKNLPQPLIFVSFSHKDKFLDKLLFDSEKKQILTDISCVGQIDWLSLKLEVV